MVFSSVIFLSVFLPVVFLASRILPGMKWKNRLLMAASVIFYAFVRLEWVPLLLFSVLCNYIGGRLVATGSDQRRKAALVGTVIVNLTLLGVFKYLDFFLSIFNGVLGTRVPLTGIELPIGISFFTFQGMSYVIDVYRSPQRGTKRFGKVLLYIAFFPQLVAGPIVKYLDIAQQIDQRTTTPEKTAAGITRFTIGLSKKLLLANTLGQAADAVYALTAGQVDIRLAWLGAVCYTLQIYFDFSGYSDMAIGLGQMFGFQFKENFRHPYASASIRDFWRRWHISLSSWFRDYVYIPLGGNRRGAARARWNRLLVFFLTGLWHGANWTFILWGLWHGLLLMVEDRFQLPQRCSKGIVGHIYTMLAVTLGFMLFRAESLTQAGWMLRAMFTGFTITPEGTAIFSNLMSPILLAVLVISLVGALPILDWWRDKVKGTLRASVTHALANPVILILLILDFLNLAATSFNPFIYFQF